MKSQTLKSWKSFSTKTGSPAPLNRIQRQQSDLSNEKRIPLTKMQRAIYWLILGKPTRMKVYHSSDQISSGRNKNYQMFTGNLKFLFGGRMAISKGKPLNLMIFSIILVTGGLFLGFL